MGPERSSTDQADPDFRTMKSDQTIGTVAWITGAGKGIGRALALRLAEEGILVAASARTLPDLESLVKESDTRPGQIVAFPLDVTDETAVVTCANQIETSLGEIDLLISRQWIFMDFQVLLIWVLVSHIILERFHQVY